MASQVLSRYPFYSQSPIKRKELGVDDSGDSMVQLAMAWATLALALVLNGCAQATATSAAYPDALTLVAIGEEALGLARKTMPDALLRQVDVSPDGGAISFRFTDELAARGADVHVPSPDVRSNDWRVVDAGLTPFIGQASLGIDLRELRAGPAAVARSATGHWSGCSVRAMTLYGDAEDLAWTVFCNLPEGVVSGYVDARTGAFTPSTHPPIQPPPSAPVAVPSSDTQTTPTPAR